MYVLENGDVLVAESSTLPKPTDEPGVREAKAASGSAGPSANRVTLLRGRDKNGMPKTRRIVVEGISQPFGMLLLNGNLYVAATDALWRYPFDSASGAATGPGKKLLDLPAGGYNNHWTRNLLASPDGKKIYISVGSASNVGEHGMDVENRRANILQVNPDGSGEVAFASGIRNPTAMAWAPGSTTLWAVANERDALGDELVPDYLTSVREGGFYGWPYSYFGKHEDPRRKGERPDLVSKAIVPDVPLGSHTASLGMTFYKGSAFPERFRNGVFVTQHGSWNRSKLAGYKVVFVPFTGGKPAEKHEDFLTGFIKDESTAEVYGRPVGIAEYTDGSLLISGDADGVIWKVKAL
jgi:glucose/arabinose dehydrogenase